MDCARQQLLAALDPLVEQLQAALSSPATDASAPAAMPTTVSPAQSREAGAQLTQLLSEFDPGATDFIEANHAALRSLFAGDGWPEFEKLVQCYSFADAQVQLEQALRKFPYA